MNNHSQYYQDMSEAYIKIDEVTETLAKKFPTEIIATVLLCEALARLEEFSDLEQWEAVKSELLDIRDEFEKNAERYWSSSIDRDEVEKQYNRRYG